MITVRERERERGRVIETQGPMDEVTSTLRRYRDWLTGVHRITPDNGVIVLNHGADRIVRFKETSEEELIGLIGGTNGNNRS